MKKTNLQILIAGILFSFRKSLKHSIASFIFIALIASNLTMAQDKCSDILSKGIFNAITIDQNEGVKNDYNDWVCTSEFNTHMEANQAGVAVGFPVYGVPVKLGSNFDKAQRESWKKAHCSGRTDKSQYSASYQKLISSVSEIIVMAWRDCMIASFEQRIGLSSIAKARGSKQVVMHVQWRPNGQFDTRLPKVTGYSIVGARQATVGSSLFKIGSKVPSTETIIDFIRESPSDPVTLTLNTDRGSVTGYVPAQTMSISVSAELKPSIEVRKTKSKGYEFYAHTPKGHCTPGLNFDESYYPEDGYTLTTFTSYETTKAGRPTRFTLEPDAKNNRVHATMHVEGHDDGLGFCASHGWLGLKIQVNGERWERTRMTSYKESVQPKLLQESIVIKYPYLLASPDHKNLKMAFVAKVQKIIGDEVITVELTEGSPQAGGIEAKTDASGNLIIDATKAMEAWRTSLAKL